MTLRAIVGLASLNALYLTVGSSLLWAVRGFRSWGEYLTLAGLAYLLGVAALGVTWTLLLILGVELSMATILVTGAGLALGGVVVGRRAGRDGVSPTVTSARSRLALVTAASVTVTGVFVEALFRAARLHGLYAFDAWAFWIPKAKAIYYYGGLDEQFFTELPGPSYPPLLPILDAAAFHAMASPDVVTLHLQFWWLSLGFVAAVAGLLWHRVPLWMLWPLLLLTLVMPRTSVNLVTPQADFLLDFLVVVAALLLTLWLLERSPWQLAAATVLLSAAVLTKREGVLLALILVGSLAAVSVDRWRFAWPRIALCAAVVAAVGVPWRIWYTTHGIGGEAPTTVDLGRAKSALRLSLEVFFSTPLWSLLPALGIAAVVLAAIWGNRRLALFVGAVLLLIVLGGAWITVAYPELPITADEATNPIVRYTASAVLLAGVSAPLLLAGVWARGGRAESAVG